MLKKQKLKKQDFMFENGWFEDIHRGPGQLHMQQFQISDCEECGIYLFDSSACVYVDQCKFCTIFVGACQSSIFIRGCQHVTVIATTQQFRVRDCQDCHFAIFCQSQPVIESSFSIKFSCFPQIGYQGMLKHMGETKTSPWNNNWFDVYDFTPKKFNRENHVLAELPQAQWADLSKKLQQIMTVVGVNKTSCIIPRVKGRQAAQTNQAMILVIKPVPLSQISGSLQILQSRQAKLLKVQQQQLQLNLTQESPRIHLLFLKIEQKYLSKFRKIFTGIIKEVSQRSQYDLYENTIFAPFKDQH